MITLYYIKGLSRLDEPVFNTPADQKSFFDSYIIKNIDTGFYPPHFHNNITLTTDDINYTSSCNYLMLDYNDKNYYYFIDNIEYVSEDTINLNITMDTIQTFMFNISFGDTLIKRKSIKRWNDAGRINREYIRENLSKGIFKSKLAAYILDDISWYIVWLRSAGSLVCKADDDTYFELPTPNSFTMTNGSNSDYRRSAPIYATPICFPVSNNPTYSEITINGNPATPTFSLLCELPNVIRIVRIDKDIFSNYFTRTKTGNTIKLVSKSMSQETIFRLYYDDATRVLGTDGTITYTHEYTAISSVLMPLISSTVPSSSKSVITNSKLSMYLPNFQKNTKTKVTFTSNLVPAMLDENYMHIMWGERMSYITYPLHQLNTYELYYTSIIDWFNCTRMYALTDGVYSGTITDPYTSVGIVNTQEYVDLYNDAWLNYYSTHQATWTIGYNLNKQQLLYKFYSGEFQTLGNTIGSMMGGTMHSQGSSLLMSSGQFNDSMIPAYMGNTGRTWGSAVQGITKGVGLVADYFQGNYVLDQQREITRGDLEATPDTEKQGNTLTADVLLGSTMQFLNYEEIDDFEQVATIYERTGYAVVDKVYDKNLFTYSNNRYYYDCITAEIYQLNLVDYITDESVIANIKMRFSSGLRLWHTTAHLLNANFIGDYLYDNIEVDFIE